MDRTLCNKIVQWNKMRYTRKYNNDLFSSLLFEEYTEYVEAITMVSKLDGLADLYFIVIGALWKMKLNPYEYLYKEQFLLADINYKENKESQKSSLLFTVKKILETNELDLIKLRLGYLIEIITKEFNHIGCAKSEAALALNIICDSNDTKIIMKLKNHDKGNLKGDKFISPIKRLQLLAEVMKNAR